MPTSDQQKLANQQNALKSTGPKTKAGKDRSRRNSLKHGLAGMGSVLPAEDMELFQERRLAWAGEEEPKGQVENYLVAVAALASVKLDRCARNEFAAIAKKRREALRNWQRRQDRRIKRAARTLETDPRAARAELEEFASGCGWLVEQWEELVQALDESGHWTEEQIARAGRLVNDDAAETLRAHALVLRPDQGIEPSARDAAMAGVRSIAAAEIERLSNERADIWYEAEGPDLAEAIDLATIDLSPDGALRHRYSVSANSDLHRSFARLAKRQEASAKRRNAEDKAAKDSADPQPTVTWYRERMNVPPDDPTPMRRPTPMPMPAAPEAPFRNEADKTTSSVDQSMTSGKTTGATTGPPRPVSSPTGGPQPVVKPPGKDVRGPSRPAAGPP